MAGPKGIAERGYTHQTYDEEIDKTVSFREFEMERDLARLHAWFNEPHVLPYWTQDDPLPTVRETLAERTADGTQTLYIGCLNHVPMSYWESYWAAHDGVSAYYDAEPTDQGIHLLIGPPEYLGKGYATPLLRSMTALQFRHGETSRVVTEPDVRNERAIRVFENCGFEREKQIQTDEKDAQLMICRREQFQEVVA